MYKFEYPESTYGVNMLCNGINIGSIVISEHMDPTLHLTYPTVYDGYCLGSSVTFTDNLEGVKRELEKWALYVFDKVAQVENNKPAQGDNE